MADDQRAELERKKREVRERLEQQSASRKKKGFMTPERKKKLRLLLRKKAAEELKKEQERKAAERRRVIDQRCGNPKNVDNISEVELKALCKDYHKRISDIENNKFDMEKEVELRDYKINELNIAVNDLRGKFIKPTLKKVSKYENKFAKLQKKAAEFNFRNQLKTVKKKEFTMDEEEPGEHKKPDWALGEKDGKKAGPPHEGEDGDGDDGDEAAAAAASEAAAAADEDQPASASVANPHDSAIDKSATDPDNDNAATDDLAVHEAADSQAS